MITTNPVKRDTLKWLKRLGEEQGSASYAQAIIRLIMKGRGQKSGFGLLGKEHSRAEVLEGLRDKHDRFWSFDQSHSCSKSKGNLSETGIALPAR